MEEKKKKWPLFVAIGVAALAVIGALLYFFLPRTYYLPIFVRVSENNGQEITVNEYEYDEAGRLTKAVVLTRYPGDESFTENVTAYKYDANGDLKSATVTQNGKKIITIKYTYKNGALKDMDVTTAEDHRGFDYAVKVNKAGRITEIREWDKEVPEAINYTTTYKYYDDGRLKEKDRIFGKGHSYRSVTRFDQEGRQTENIQYEGETVTQHTRQSYDDKGNLNKLVYRGIYDEKIAEITIDYEYKGSRLLGGEVMIEASEGKVKLTMSATYDDLEGEITVDNYKIYGNVDSLDLPDRLGDFVINFEVNEDGKLLSYTMCCGREVYKQMQTEYEKVTLPRGYHVPYFNDPIWFIQI